MRQSGLTTEEKFVIDLHGYIVIPKVLTKNEVHNNFSEVVFSMFCLLDAGIGDF